MMNYDGLPILLSLRDFFFDQKTQSTSVCQNSPSVIKGFMLWSQIIIFRCHGLLNIKYDVTDFLLLIFFFLCAQLSFENLLYLAEVVACKMLCQTHRLELLELGNLVLTQSKAELVVQASCRFCVCMHFQVVDSVALLIYLVQVSTDQI